ncbi:hypothetical protein ACQ4LE_008219 [Meloidogyne hapla]
MHNVEIILSECRLNIAKTRKILAMPASGTALPISTIGNFQHPSVWIKLYSGDEGQNDDDSFYIIEDNEHEINNHNPKSHDMKRIRNTIEMSAGSEVIKFRPFGILEPQSAKIALENIQSILPLLCDAANIRYRVLALDKEMIKLTV